MKPKIVIVAGGLATRMHPITEQIPKCLVDINGKPLIQHQLEFFRDNNFNRVIFCVAHLADKVKEYFENGSKFGVNIEYSQEPKELLGTAGAVKLVEPIAEEVIIVYYGDNLTNMNFDELLRFHENKKSDFTIVLRERPKDYKSSSLISMNENNQILVFREKPSQEFFEEFKDVKTYINNGIYVMSKKVFSVISPNVVCDFAKQVIPELIDKKFNVYGYVANDFFREIGRIEKYAQFRDEIKSKKRVL